MNEFKTGDKVKVVSNSYCGAFKGVVGTVVKYSLTNHPDFPYDVDFNDGEEGWPFNPNELELVEDQS
jgi:hypothetical protein